MKLHNQNHKAILAINAVGALAVVWAVFHPPSTSWLLVAVALHYFNIVVALPFAHRCFAHKAIKPRHPAVAYVMATIGACYGQGSPTRWHVAHNVHHRYSDTEHDPHGLDNDGWRRVFGSYSNKHATRVQTKALVKQIRTDPWYPDPYFKAMHNYSAHIMVSFNALLLAVGGMDAMIYGGILPACSGLLALNAIGYFSHVRASWVGYQNFDLGTGTGKNVWWLLPLSAGEAWHNNHHKFPNATTTRVKWWEFDPNSIALSLLTVPANRASQLSVQPNTSIIN